MAPRSFLSRNMIVDSGEVRLAVVSLRNARSLLTASRLRRAFFSRFTFLFLGLAFCVFSWGLQYKLSLYDPPHAVSREIPQAKLLSKDEQSLTTANPLAESPSPSHEIVQTVFYSLFAAFFLVLTAPRGLALYGKHSHSAQPVRPCRFASLNAFFFRPPPVLA